MDLKELQLFKLKLLLMVAPNVLILLIRLLPVDIVELLVLVLVRAMDLKEPQHFTQ
jgi:hypothetical protein